ncbi:hypothetical protein E4U21_000936 [Claviceps maximensis]|nr:hypothetical protein E4U21_000936 [Claviceps maximensis]
MDLQASLNYHAELVEQLKCLPEEQAVQLLRNVRARPRSRDALMDSLHGAMHGQYRPSDLETAKCLSPRTDSFLEFELAARHRFIYPETTPLEISQLVALLNSSGLKTTDKFSKGLSSPQTSRPLSVLQGRSLVTSHSRPSSSTASTSVSDTADSDASDAYQLCDPRLRNLKIKSWTDVAIPDKLAASAISLYLESEHPIIGAFDADLFVADLVEQRKEHCSHFLVSAVLFYACQAYARHDPQSLSYVSEFLEEATTRWQSTRNFTHSDLSSSELSPYESITSLSAIIVMNLACQLYSKEELGYALLQACRQIATEIGLIDAALDSPRLEHLEKHSKIWRRAASHVAWGAYNWISSVDVSLANPTESDTCPDDFTTPFPLHMGRTFQTLCEFWTLMQEVFAVYNKLDSRPLRERVSLAFAEAKYQKLLAWSDNVESSVSREEHSPGHVLIFHDGCPAAIVAASLKHMECVMFQFQQHLVSGTWSAYINSPLIQLADAMLNPRFRNVTNRRLFFLLCVRGWVHLYSGFPLFWEVVQGFAARALKERLMSSDEARELLRAVSRQGCYHKISEQATSSRIIIDFNLAEENPKLATIKHIAEQFEDLALQEEFTTGSFEFADDDSKV